MQKRKLLVSLAAAMLSLSFFCSPAKAAAMSEKKLVPLGKAVGMDFSLNGVTVSELATFHQAGRTVAPAKEAGIEPGDVILSVAGQTITAAEDVKRISETLDGSPIHVEIQRGGAKKTMIVTPFQNEEGNYALGIWMRDGIMGIGTLTFYDAETGTFGALGHPVCDDSHSDIAKIQEGKVYKAKVQGVVEGQVGHPGQLEGDFDCDIVVGKVYQNTEGGVFGRLKREMIETDQTPVTVAEENEIRLGKAKILSNVRGEDVEEYDVEITRIYSGKDTRSFMIQVTDKELLLQTGGIVQGMSGSPILQNGKLIGAVTHVLVNDPTRGYGISMEKMLEKSSTMVLDGQIAA